MRKALFETEAAMAAVLIDWLRPQGWEIYQEVPWCGCADIVATRGPLLWVIECKLQLSLDLIEQGCAHTRHAHWVSLAVPAYGRRNGSRLMHDILGHFGLGLLEVRPAPTNDWSRSDWISERRHPDLRRRIAPGLRASLCEEHKSYAAAGSAAAPRWTAFKSTCRDIRAYVQNHPGCALREMLEAVPTHYRSSGSTVRARLAQLIEEGIVEGVRLEHSGKDLRLFPVDAFKLS